jgi:hypothetical protein
VNLLGTNGDADNDSITNLSEYTAAAGNRDAYLASNGFGDSGEGEGEGEEGEGEGEDECLNGLLADEGAFLGIYLGGTAYAPVLAAFGQTSDWNTLDLEQFEATAYAAAQELPQSSWPVPGDGLPDAIQMAMLEAVLCDPGHYLYATVVAQFEENKTFFAEDVAALEAPAFMALGNLLPGMMGTSATMQATVDALLGQGVVHLPHLADYHVFGAAKTSEDPFAADGDIDGDEISNKAEYEQVLATGGSASVAVQAIMDEHNFWPGNPALPALSAAGLVALAGALVMARFRRKQ